MTIDTRRLARLARTNIDDGPSIVGHRAIVRELTARADQSIAAAALDDAAFLAGVAAEFAWLNHPGSFVDPIFEDVLGRIGRGALAAPGGRSRPGGPLGRGVVHVLTQVAQLGGHSRLAWRWIEADPARRHSVVLTQRPDGPLPPALEAAVGRAGGTVARLDGSPRRRIADLAQTVSGADSVVLHVDPGDIVAVAALSGSDHPPVILVNHADHVAWPGASIADAIACIRSSGRELARRRRNIPSSRLALVPIPIPPPAALPSEGARADARAGLGIPEGAIVIASVASPYKFRPIAGVGMIDLANGIVDADPRLRLLVAGPPTSGMWAALEARTHGRARALGAVADLQPLFAAADLYLDSYPFASLTSLLEAGSHGLPLVALQDQPAGCEVLAADSPGLADLVTAVSLPALVGRLTELADDRAQRERLGRRTAQTIASAHSGATWRGAVEEATAVAQSAADGRSIRGADLDAEPDAGAGAPGPLDHRLIELHRGLGGLDRAISRRMVDRGAVDRLGLAVALGRDVRRAAIVASIPPPLRRALRRTAGRPR